MRHPPIGLRRSRHRRFVNQAFGGFQRFRQLHGPLPPGAEIVYCPNMGNAGLPKGSRNRSVLHAPDAKGGNMFVIMDIWHSINSIFTSADIVTLVIMAVIALGAGFAMQGMGSLVTATFGALVVFGLAGFVRAVTTGKKDAMALAQSDWHSLLGLQMQV